MYYQLILCLSNYSIELSVILAITIVVIITRILISILRQGMMKGNGLAISKEKLSVRLHGEPYGDLMGTMDTMWVQIGCAFVCSAAPLSLTHIFGSML